MEKISSIVRGSPRTASVDLKSASAVRPGALGFGRPVGESSLTTPKEGTTAQRAVALQAELAEKRAMGPDKVIQQMADQFFMSRIRRPEEAREVAAASPVEQKVQAEEAQELFVSEDEHAQPNGYVPRGSYVDVRV